MLGRDRHPDKLILCSRSFVPSDRGADVLHFEDIATWSGRFTLLTRMFGYSEVDIRVPRLDAIPRPAALAIVGRLLCRGTCRFVDGAGHAQTITVGEIARRLGRFMSDAVRRRGLVRQMLAIIAELEATGAVRTRCRDGRNFLYLKTDLWFGVTTGGAVAHTVGVLNAMVRRKWAATLLAVEPIAGLDQHVSSVPFSEMPGYWDFAEMPHLDANFGFLEEVERQIEQQRPAFLYQRYSLFNFVGAWASRRNKIPLILEYNGSESWIARNWGRALRNAALSDRIELLNLACADVIITVSDAMRKTVLAKGIEPAKVFAIPNGVSPDSFASPSDVAAARERLGIDAGHLVIAFVGGFSIWHGTVDLARAFTELIACRPALRSTGRLLLIGDGPQRAAVERTLKEGGVDDLAIFTGPVPAADVPHLLAASDILVAPHVPNPDGTAFFGSPIKLFEYMAAGKAIVASRLGQIGEILEHDRTALLSEPGDPSGLAANIERLADDAALRASLGNAARAEVLRRYTWDHHVDRILTALERRCGLERAG